MYLSGLVHRHRLFDIATRWLADQPRKEDGQVLTEIFAFERAVTAPTVRAFVADLCRVGYRGDLYLERIASKDRVRQAIVAAAAYPSPRAAELFDWYRQLPEEFFPRTPVHMSLVTRHNGSLAALVRRKRIRRIADKVSRRVTDELAGMIDDVSHALAASRPRAHGAPRFADGKPHGVPRGVLGAAERLVADRIRSGRLTLDPETQRVDDVIGVKILGTPDELIAIEKAVDGFDHVSAFEREVHHGQYVGTHLLVELALPAPEEMIRRTQGLDWSFASGRGLATSELEPRFRRYVESGARTFTLELILTTFDALVESEFGDSIHEQRILDQRDLASDFGRIATNASSIIEYMLRLATSPTVEIEELPFKLWGRYIRDTVALAIAELDHGGSSEWLVPTHGDGELMPL